MIKIARAASQEADTLPSPQPLGAPILAIVGPPDRDGGACVSRRMRVAAHPAAEIEHLRSGVKVRVGAKVEALIAAAERPLSG
jgi:hypothetical protein